MFTVWLPGNTGLCWKKATDRKTRASELHRSHVASPRFKFKESSEFFFMSLLPRDVQRAQHVTSHPVCVNGYVWSHTEPSVTYAYVRATATHRDAASE